MRSFRGPTLVRIQPRECRDKMIMNGNLTGSSRPWPLQVLDFMSARDFEEAQHGKVYVGIDTELNIDGLVP